MTGSDSEYNAKNWRDGAACAEIGGDLWFPGKGERRAAARAKTICETCEVARFCLQEAVGDPTIQHGIWGGATPRELRRLRAESGLRGAELPEDIEPEDESVYD